MAERTRPDKAPTNDPGHSPASNRQGTPFQRFEDFVKKIAVVPREELDDKRAEYEQERKRKREAG